MKKKIYIYIFIFFFILCYISVGHMISGQAKKVLEAGMKPNLEYQNYMTEDVYNTINPSNRIGGYEDEYNPAHHSYKSNLIPLHFFFTASVTTYNYYNNGDIGFNEKVIIKMNLKKGKWIATRVTIQA
ncbi:hypothetical protein I6N90_19315 [Paenibacillus sp. GSMTC-2017]|uniref:hypothetical protein n=1 Tax=Paenibacillus sp. GSMTC-2017 TaxID=2794350 RepID=UPI0018D612D3|nr:hypothetical protein [Paenibacillus sp. GSMTC-2017]MBH5319953.1 hypothetical protein [Paenibacillus sp. GSMTC-2017]